MACAIAIPVERQAAFGGQGLEQLGWDAIRLIETGRFAAIDHYRRGSLHRFEDAFDALQSTTDGREEIIALLCESHRPRAATVDFSSG